MGFFNKIFGGSKSTSGNQAYEDIKGQYAPQMATGQAATQQAAQLLGVGAPPPPVNALEGGASGVGGMMAPAMTGEGAAAPAAGNGGFQNFLDSSGFNWAMDQGSRAITGNAAARGLLKSGSTLKRLSEYGTGLGQQYFTNYLDRLNQLSQQGLQAGGLVANAGQTSKSSSNKGIAGLAGSVVGGFL